MIDYILEGLSDGVLVVDKRQVITTINTRALGIFGATEEVRGRKLAYLLPDGKLAEAITRAEMAVFEFTHNGRIYLAKITPLQKGDMLAVLTDVTENREHAKRREEFFANASHELKTPLAAIMGFAEILSASEKSDLAQKISSQAARMLSLVEGMLDISRMEAAQEITPVPCNLEATIREVLSALQPEIDRLELKLKFTGRAVIQAEPAHLYDMVKNIIENAVRYNRHGGKLRIKIARGTLSVRDTGIGIPLAEQGKVFERFYRVEKSRALSTGGSGLGLAIVKHICRLYNWQLSLRSRREVGTEVRVVFSPGE